MLGAALGIPVVLAVLMLGLERLERTLDRSPAPHDARPAPARPAAERAPAVPDARWRPLPLT